MSTYDNDDTENVNAMVEARPVQSLTLSANDVRAQVALIQQVMRDVMKPDTHYGVIPGTDKPTLYKAGGEKLCATFRLGAEYDIVDKEREDGHLSITARCTLFHIPTGQRVGSALGSCSTRETKYAYRKGGRVCPTCGAEAIARSKPEYGGGWYCNTRRDGCGAKFGANDPAITAQQPGRVENDDIPDSFNTVLKMACKRAMLAAVLNATAASDIFVQDLGLDPHDREAGFGGEESPPTDSTPRREPAPKSTDNGAKVTAGALRILRAKIKAAGKEEMKFAGVLGVERLEDLPASRINEALVEAAA